MIMDVTRCRHALACCASLALALLLLGLTAAGTAAAATDYQAEDATISQGAVATNHLNYTGTGFVDYTNVTGSYVQFTVNAASAGTYTLTFRHANGSTANRPMAIAVNGSTVNGNLAFNPTANWDT